MPCFHITRFCQCCLFKDFCTLAPVLSIPQAYKDSGDAATKNKGGRIWIAEMYGYSFGAAKSNVWHIWKEDFMLYPSYTPNRE